VLSWISADALWAQLLIGGFSGAVVYLLASWMLRVKEIQQLLQYGRERMAR